MLLVDPDIHALILRDNPAHQNSSPAWIRFQRCQQLRYCRCRRAPRPAPHFNMFSELSAIIFSVRLCAAPRTENKTMETYKTSLVRMTR